MIKKIIVCLISLVIGSVFLQTCTQQKPYKWDLPYKIPKPQVPANNPMSHAKVELGRALFFDTALSSNNTTSCSSCHQPSKAFSEPKARSVGATGDSLKRNALALVNVAYNSHFTWAHNQISSIEQQMLLPLFSQNPVEMGASEQHQEIILRFSSSDYQALFSAAYGNSEVTFDKIIKATAAFVRSLVSFNSPFDAYAYGGNDKALSDEALRGLDMFFSEKFECFHCHGGINFSQSSKHEYQQLSLEGFHNTGMFNVDGQGAYPVTDQGLIEVSLSPSDMGKFRAPTLRNIALTAPYMHNGSIDTLEEVIAFYANGGSNTGNTNPHKSLFVRGFEITEQETRDIIAFLESLTDPSFVNKPEHQAMKTPPKVNLSGVKKTPAK